MSLDFEELDKVKHGLNTVNSDFSDETMAQNATKMDSGGNDSGVLDLCEHDRRREKSVEERS